MMLKKIKWLVFFASEKTQTCFQRDVRRKPFSKQVTKTGKKATERFDKHWQSKCHKSYIWSDSSTMSKWPWNDRWKWKETQGIKLAYLPYHSRNFAYLTHQGLAVRGDDDYEYKVIQLLRRKWKTFPELTDWLSKNDRKIYYSWLSEWDYQLDIKPNYDESLEACWQLHFPGYVRWVHGRF